MGMKMGMKKWWHPMSMGGGEWKKAMEFIEIIKMAEWVEWNELWLYKIFVDWWRMLISF